MWRICIPLIIGLYVSICRSLITELYVGISVPLIIGLYVYILVYIVPNNPGRTAKSKMAGNKIREKVTSRGDIMWCRADAMAVRVAPCLAVPFGVVPWRQQLEFVSTWRWNLYPRANVMVDSSAVKVRCGCCRQRMKVRWRTPELLTWCPYSRGEMGNPQAADVMLVPPKRWDGEPPRCWRDSRTPEKVGWRAPEKARWPEPTWMRHPLHSSRVRIRAARHGGATASMESLHQHQGQKSLWRL